MHLVEERNVLGYVAVVFLFVRQFVGGIPQTERGRKPIGQPALFAGRLERGHARGVSLECQRHEIVHRREVFARGRHIHGQIKTLGIHLGLGCALPLNGAFGHFFHFPHGGQILVHLPAIIGAQPAVQILRFTENFINHTATTSECVAFLRRGGSEHAAENFSRIIQCRNRSPRPVKGQG